MRHPFPLSTAALAAALAFTVACEDQQEPTTTRAAASATTLDAVAADQTAAVAAAGTIPLPINQSVTSTGAAFHITQRGTGDGGIFEINNSTSPPAPGRHSWPRRTGTRSACGRSAPGRAMPRSSR